MNVNTIHKGTSSSTRSHMSQRCSDALERINHELSVEYIFIDLLLAITLSGMGEMSHGTTCYYYMTYDRVRNVVLFFFFFYGVQAQ